MGIFSRTSRLLMITALATTVLVGAAPAPTSAHGTGHCCSRTLLDDRFDDDADPAFTFFNRTGSIHDGQLWIDGDYPAPAVERDGWALTHVGDRSWRDYRMLVRYDSTNPGGSPPEVHMTTLYLRVAATGTSGRDTAYRLDLWDPGMPDPTGQTPVLDRGLVQLTRYRDGVGTLLLQQWVSHTVTGVNTALVTVVRDRISARVNGHWTFTVRDSEPIRFGGAGIGQIWETVGSFDRVAVCAVGHGRHGHR
jgi:hypothetical protein